MKILLKIPQKKEYTERILLVLNVVYNLSNKDIKVLSFFITKCLYKNKITSQEKSEAIKNKIVTSRQDAANYIKRLEEKKIIHKNPDDKRGVYIFDKNILAFFDFKKPLITSVEIKFNRAKNG